MIPTYAAGLGSLLLLVMATSLAAEPKKDAPAKKNVESKKTVNVGGKLVVEWGGPGSSTQPAIDPSAGVLAGESPASVKIEKALDEPTEVAFIEAPLTDAMEFLARKHGIEIQLGHKALDEAGVAEDTQITRNLKNVKLRSALNLMLEGIELTYIIRDEVLLITTVSDAETIMSTRIYPIGDLLRSRTRPVRSSTLAAELIEILTDTLAPTTWSEVGGAGSIKYWSGNESLVVSQPYSIHREIRDFLTALRKSHELQGAKMPEQAAVEQPDGLYVAVYRVPRQLQLMLQVGIGFSPAAKNDKQAHAAHGGTLGWVHPSRVVVEDLAKAIPRLVDPKSWKAKTDEEATLFDSTSGGKGSAAQGVIEIVGNELFILQTAKVHQQIGDFLEVLAAANEITSGF